MSSAAKDTSANDDVLASIRRLVAEESARGQSTPEPKSVETAQVPPDPGPQPDAPRQGRVLQRRRAPESGTVVDRQSINRAARAKLLLTDDFRVEELERWEDDTDEIALPPETELEAEEAAEVDTLPEGDSEPEGEPDAETAPEPTVHGRGVYDDEDQALISKDIDSFLSGGKPEGAVAQRTALEEDPTRQDVSEAAPVQEMSFEDIPDAVLTASQDRAARRREASARATSETTRASAALRAPVNATEAPTERPHESSQPVAETPVEVQESAAEVTPAPLEPDVAALEVQNQAQHQASVPVATVDQIEAAVQASLAAIAEQGDLAGPAEPELVLDEEMLREMVSEIVRRELQGSLGERITRNVRKLVRREIYRALETRDLG